jgi:hypothetical protein
MTQDMQIERVLTVQKCLIGSQTKVVDLHLLCGKNIGQSGQRGSEVGFSDPFLKVHQNFENQLPH